MEKILNILKYNTYGLNPMINKHIYMERHDLNNDMYFIFQVKSILSEKLPVKYECNRLYILEVPKDKNKKAYVHDNLRKLELLNNDTLYQISLDEYLGIFKSFVELSGSKMKLNKGFFIV